MDQHAFCKSEPSSYVFCTNDVLLKGGSKRDLNISPIALVATGADYHFSSWTSLPLVEKEDDEGPQRILHHRSALMAAAEVGDVSFIRAVLRDPAEKLTVNDIDHLGRNALHLAIASRASAPAVEELLRAGADPNVKDNVGMTPLSLCVLRSPSVKMIQLLFDHGAKLLPRDGPADSGLFLHFVSVCRPTSEERKILQMLLQHGALINDPEAPGQRQALHLAAMSNNCELIRSLVDLGADLAATNHRHDTAKQTAINYRCKEAQFCLEELEYRNLFERDTAINNKKNGKVTFRSKTSVAGPAAETAPRLSSTAFW